ncbi:MMPL family transporter [Spirillospora sp. CA-142024]|uniref:MMPL family transporter n=1 Tax=Spirillospora sp. CA-142024 TaxID=3240036 RepID=UPI003D8A11FA
MAALLYRLGRWSYRRRGLVLAAWLLLLVVLGGAAAAFSAPTTSEFRMPGTESQRATDVLKDHFPQAGGATGTIVIAAPADRRLQPSEVEPVIEQAKTVPGVSAVTDPFTARSVSPDGRYALVQVQFAAPAADLSDAQRTAFTRISGDTGGLRVETGGEAAKGASEAGAAEVIGVAVAAVVLIITFGSLVAAGMTLVNALVGVGAGMAGLFALTGAVELHNATPVLALMLGLAVGIDYSLFITSRYRQLLLEGLDAREAAGRAVGTAGSAVMFAGATVVIALAGLSVVGIPFLTAMGLAGAATVAVAVVVALTLLPAVLAFVGTRVLPRGRRSGSVDHSSGSPSAESGIGYRWGRVVTRFRLPVLLVGVLALGALALPVSGMRLALPDASTAAENTHEHRAYDLVSEGFGPGYNGRLIAVVSGDDAGATRAAARKTVTLVRGVDGVDGVAAAQFNKAGTTALIGIVPTTAPTDQTTEDTVHAIRDGVADISGARVALTGATAVGIDISEKLTDALPVYLLLVVGLSILLLMLVFRSVLVPLKAAAGFLLTVGAAFGITTAVFQEGHLAGLAGVGTPGPLVNFLPILLIGILFGLAMDYEVFLVSKMREDHVHGATPRQAVINGLGHNARVVTAAALIMIAVFAGFMLTPDPVIKSIGFSLAVGVFVDAFIVRMTLVPAAMSLLGRAAWWLPRPLEKALPNFDIEGAELDRSLETPDPRQNVHTRVG